MELPTSRSRRVRVGAVQVHRVARHQRRVGLVRRDGRSDLVWAFFVASGAVVVQRDGRGLTIGAGEGIFVLDEQGVSATSMEGTDAVGVAMPRDLLDDLAPGDVDFALTKPESALIAPVVSFLEQVEDPDDDATTLSRSVMEWLVQRMLLGVLTESLDSVRDRPDQLGAYDRARLFIAAHRDLDRLDSSAVAEHVRLSVRQLERVFRANGTSVGSAIRRTRVDRAVDLLGDPQAAGLSVDHIARLAGFASGSSLARAFAREQLAPPSSHRIRATAQHDD